MPRVRSARTARHVPDDEGALLLCETGRAVLRHHIEAPVGHGLHEQLAELGAACLWIVVEEELLGGWKPRRLCRRDIDADLVWILPPLCLRDNLPPQGRARLAHGRTRVASAAPRADAPPCAKVVLYHGTMVRGTMVPKYTVARTVGAHDEARLPLQHAYVTLRLRKTANESTRPARRGCGRPGGSTRRGGGRCSSGGCRRCW